MSAQFSSKEKTLIYTNIIQKKAPLCYRIHLTFYKLLQKMSIS